MCGPATAVSCMWISFLLKIKKNLEVCIMLWLTTTCLTYPCPCWSYLNLLILLTLITDDWTHLDCKFICYLLVLYIFPLNNAKLIVGCCIPLSYIMIKSIIAEIFTNIYNMSHCLHIRYARSGPIQT